MEVGLIGRLSVKTGMRTSLIIQAHILADRQARLADAVIGQQIHLFIFYSAPQPLDEDIVTPGALAEAGTHSSEPLGCDDVLAVLYTGANQIVFAQRHRRKYPAFIPQPRFYSECAIKTDWLGLLKTLQAGMRSVPSSQGSIWKPRL